MRAIILALCALITLVTPAAARTERTGDRIDGIAVIDRLDTGDLESGTVHRFWFRAGGNSIGQGWYVPVIVIKGRHAGRRLLVTAGLHGDELNGIAVIHRLAGMIDPETLNGTLLLIPGLNTPGLLHSTRGFTPAGGTGGDNLNRAMPGDEAASDISSAYAGRLWNRLMQPNADQAIDLHTQSRGTAYAYFLFAETEAAMRIARAIAPDIIRRDPGIRGALENELNRVGIPAVTLELERPELFDPRTIGRAIDSIRRVMADMGMIAASTVPAATITPIVANNGLAIRSARGGWASLSVSVNQTVAAGDTVATVSDPFGRIVETVRAPRDGRVSSIVTDPRVEPGGQLLRIVFDDPDPRCANGCE